MPGSSPKLLRHAAAFFGFAVLSVLMTWPLAANLGTHVVKAKWYYDSMVNLHILGSRVHYALGLSPGLQSVYDNYFCAPTPYSISVNENHFGLSLLFAPFFIVTGDPLLSYNLLLLLCLTLSGFCAYLLVRELTGNALAGVLAGVGYAFCPYLFFELGRIQLVAAQWIPLFALFLHRTAAAPTWPNALGLGLTFAMQVGSCLYYTMFLVVYAVTAGTWLLLSHRPSPRALLPKLAVAGALSVALAAFMVYPYFRARADFSLTRSEALTTRYAGKLEHLLQVYPENKTLAFLRDNATGPEEPISFPGFVLLALALVALVTPIVRSHGWPPGTLPRRLLGVAMTTVGAGAGVAVSVVLGDLTAGFVVLALTFLLWRRLRAAPLLPNTTFLYACFLLLSLALFLGPLPFQLTSGDVIGPYHYLYHYVPGFDGIRYASRFAVLVMLSLAVLAGYGAALLLQGRRAVQLTVFGVLLAAMLLELRNVPMTLAMLPNRSNLPPVYAWLARRPGPEPIATMPAYTMGYYGARNDYFALFHRRRTIDGKSSWMPPVTYAFIYESRRFPRTTTMRLLEALGAKYLVVHAEEYNPARRKRVLDWLYNRRDKYPLRFSHGQQYVYEILRGGTDEAPSLLDSETLPEGAKPIAHSELSLGASVTSGLERTMDGDPKTRWTTRKKQMPGHFFEFGLARPRKLAALELSGFEDAFEAPAAFRLTAVTESGEVQVVSRRAMRFYRDQVYHPKSFVFRLVFPEPVAATSLRLQLTDGVAGHPWTIGEAALYALD